MEKMKTKRISLTVPAEDYDRLRQLGKKAGFPEHWLSDEFAKLIVMLRVVAEQSVIDAQLQREMTKKQAKKRYEKLALEAANKVLTIK